MIEIAFELSDPEVMQSKHTMFCIFQKKILATGRPVAKTLIKYNSDNLEENDEEEKEPINIELTDKKKTDPFNDENSIDSKWSYLTEEVEEDIALANFLRAWKKQTDEKIFPKN